MSDHKTDPYHVTIRRLPNGAIDTDHYLAESSRIRSREAYRLINGTKTRAIRAWVCVKAAAVALHARISPALTLFPSAPSSR